MTYSTFSYNEFDVRIVYSETIQSQRAKLWYEIEMWNSCNSIEGLDFPVYYKGTEPSDYDQACTVLAMDGVTLQELATMFPDSFLQNR